LPSNESISLKESAYESILLVEPGVEFEDDPMVRIVSRLGYDIPRIDCKPRKRLMMWVEDGRPQMGVDSNFEEEDFLEDIKSKLRIFSLLSDAELNIFASGKIIYGGVVLGFERCKEDTPYAHRLIHIFDAATTSLAPHPEYGIICNIDNNPAPSTAKQAYIKPVPVWFSDSGKLDGLHLVSRQSKSKCCLLPLTRTRFRPESYFNSNDTGLRNALLKLINEFHGPVSMAQALVELQQYPLLRDFVAEGAILDADVDSGLRTITQLTVPDNKNPVAAYRRKFLQHHDKTLDALSRAVGLSLYSDIAARVSHFTFSHVSSASNKTDQKTRPRKTQARASTPEGTLSCLHRLRKQLKTAENKNQFDKLILDPIEMSHESFNHSGAEDAFLASCWRFPGDAGTDSESIPDAWRAACIEKLLPAWQHGQPFDYQLYNHPNKPSQLSGKATQWPRLQKIDDNSLEFVYSSSFSEQQRDTWKYLLPVGSRLVLGGTIILDDAISRLNDGFTLA